MNKSQDNHIRMESYSLDRLAYLIDFYFVYCASMNPVQSFSKIILSSSVYYSQSGCFQIHCAIALTRARLRSLRLAVWYIVFYKSKNGRRSLENFFSIRQTYDCTSSQFLRCMK